MLKFDGKPLFPERIAYTVPYRLSDEEAHLYTAVTDYVREEFNRAEALANAKRAGTVGFALTILQRRLASSPEAIHQSLRRRRERLESRRLRELEVLQRGGQPSPVIAFTAPELDPDDVEDLDDAPEQEVEDAEARILDQATAARSIVELKAELDTLKALESLTLGVRRRSADTKWRELASLLGEIAGERGSPLWRSLTRTRELGERRMSRVDVFRMVKRRVKAAELGATANCHTFRASGITAYLLNGGTLERAQAIAGHESPRTTQLYDRTADDITVEDIERIRV